MSYRISSSINFSNYLKLLNKKIFKNQGNSPDFSGIFFLAESRIAAPVNAIPSKKYVKTSCFRGQLPDSLENQGETTFRPFFRVALSLPAQTF